MSHIALLVPTVLCLAAATEEEEPSQVVVLLISGETGEQEALVEAVKSQMSDLDVILRVEQRPALPPNLTGQLDLARETGQEQGILAVIWFSFADDGKVLLYIADPGSDRLLVRTIKEQEGARTEAIAVIVRMSTAALLQDGEIGIEIQAVAIPEEDSEHEEETALAPKVIEDQTRGFHYLVHSVSYVYHSYSKEAPMVSGLDLQFGVRVHEKLALFAGYTFHQRIENSDDNMSLELRRHPIWLGLRFVHQKKRFGFGGSLGVVFDYTNFEITEVTDLYDSQTGGNPIFSLAPLLELHMKIIGALGVYLSAGAEIALNPSYYGYDNGAEVLLDPMRFKPIVKIGPTFEWL